MKIFATLIAAALWVLLPFSADAQTKKRYEHWTHYPIVGAQVTASLVAAEHSGAMITVPSTVHGIWLLGIQNSSATRVDVFCRLDAASVATTTTGVTLGFTPGVAAPLSSVSLVRTTVAQATTDGRMPLRPVVDDPASTTLPLPMFIPASQFVSCYHNVVNIATVITFVFQEVPL